MLILFDHTIHDSLQLMKKLLSCKHLLNIVVPHLNVYIEHHEENKNSFGSTKDVGWDGYFLAQSICNF